MKVKDFTIIFEAGAFKDGIMDIITFDIKQRTNRDLNVEKIGDRIQVTVPGEEDLKRITEIIGMIKYWKNVQ